VSARAAIAPLVLLVCVACGRAPGELERERVAAAIDAVREAPSIDMGRRRQLLQALELLPAVTPGAVGARDACVAAYRHLFDADEGEAYVRRAVEGGEELRPDLPHRLEEATASLAEAKIRMPKCERALGGLRARP
jgi:hypothetical protein